MVKTLTDARGAFSFSAVAPGDYSLTAEKDGRRSRTTHAPSQEQQLQITLVLAAPSPNQPMEFADKPNFTVAGVTDWTAVGGHGSDSTLRTSEDLARETQALQPQPSGALAHDATQPKTQADLHRFKGQQDEKMGDPLAAVHELQLAVHLDPSEENYFAWGSELLLHRAVWQAAEVFRNASKAHPSSARILTGLGTALFAGALYEDAATTLCAAADLSPAQAEPYTFMGRVQMATAKPLPCVEPRLARFAQQQQTSPAANYLYAMALCKRQAADPGLLPQIETLLKKTVALDPLYADAYLQLGILASAQHQPQQAIAWYTRALQANPQLGEAHYRLGVAYDRSGAPALARQQFALHDQIEAAQAAAIEQQRRQVKQFLVVLDAQPADPARPQ